MSKKIFFKELTKSEIIRKEKIIIQEDKIYEVKNLNENQFTIISSFVPESYGNSRKFMKHGPEVKPKRYYTQFQAINDNKTPVQLREEAFNKIKSYEFCGYTFVPLGRDKRKRKVSLVECLEGARIFAYSHQKKAPIILKSYSDAKVVKQEGGVVVVKVPSRTKRHGKFQFKITSVPFVDSLEKYVISTNIGSNHSCQSKIFNIRHKFIDDKESSGILNICAHEISAYLELIQQELDTKKNIIPIQMCPFAIPTQETVDYYLKWGNNVLIHDKKIKSKDNLRKPNRAEKEIGLWALVEKFGHDNTFFSRESRDGHVMNYRWT